MIVYSEAASEEILNFMDSQMKTLETGMTTIASIPVGRFSKEFPNVNCVVDRSYRYVSMAVSRGVLTPEEVVGIAHESSHLMVSVFDGVIESDGCEYTSGDVIVLDSKQSFKPSENALWGIVPFGYAIHLPI